MRKQKGFTLIELLVVIAIIGLLSTLAVVALNNARMKARDARRVSDIKQMQTALELYYNDNNAYPTPVSNAIPSPLVSGSVTYMATVPTNPTPVNDGTCAAATAYVYASISPYATYSLTYCLGGLTGGIPLGIHTATQGGIQ